MKLGEIYNLDAFDRFLDSGESLKASSRGFGDSADAGVILAENLTAIDPKLFEKKYPELTFVNSGISVDNTGGFSARIQSRRIIETGEFTENNDRDGNKGLISLKGEDNFLKVKSLNAQSTWDDTEIKQAQIEGVNKPAEYVKTHNKIYLRTIDQIGLVGFNGGLGLLNNTDFVSTAAAGAVNTLTAQEKYDAIKDLIIAQNDAVNNTPEYKANRVIMPVRVYNDLRATVYNSAASTDTVLEALKKNFPEIEFAATFRADTVANGGSLVNSSTVAYNNSNESMVMRIPLSLEIGEIIKISSFSYHVESRARVGGLDILETTTGYILTGL